MNFLKKTLHHSSPSSSGAHSPDTSSPRPSTPDGNAPRKSHDVSRLTREEAQSESSSRSGSRSRAAQKKEEHAVIARERVEKQERLMKEVERKHQEAYEADPLKANYGLIDPLLSGESGLPPSSARRHLEEISESCAGHPVSIRARIHHVRPLSAKVAFIVLREQLSTIQGVLVVREGQVSENMVRWAERLESETVVDVKGRLQVPQGGQEEVKSTTFHQVEILIDTMHAVGTVTTPLPFHVTSVAPPRRPRALSRAETDANVLGMQQLDQDGSIGSEVREAMKSPTAAPPFLGEGKLDWVPSGAHEGEGTGSEESSTATSPLIETPATTTPADSEVNVTVTEEAGAVAAGAGGARKKKPRNPLTSSVGVGEATRFQHRVLDLRGDTSQAIFRLEAATVRFFRRYLDDQGFIEIFSSRLQGGATESGASVFKVDYFGRTAFLAQSPQLGKQMAIAADLGRVYEIGPVFRAENSNTHRHLTEFTGLDLEMAFDRDYHEVVDMLDGVLKSIFTGLQRDFKKEIEVVKRLYPSEDLVFLEETPRLDFKEAVKMLNDSGWTENGKPIPEYEDFSTPTEKRLGALVKEKYKCDYYILDKFPASARPFYTMPDKDDPRRSNSCDFFLRGEEILSGGQRIHQAPLLEKRMKDAGVDPESMRDYVDAFRQGCPPHGGGGIGLQRVVMLFLKLGNIRWATLYPRDPRSFPEAPAVRTVAGQVDEVAANPAWRGPVADTVKYAKDKKEGKQVRLPKVEDLIAAYGDSPNTSWLDPFWSVWRDPATGAAVGYAVHGHYAVAWGRPLCDNSQLVEVVREYAHFLKDKKLKPIWACVDKPTEEALIDTLKWKGVAAVAEQRLDPSHIDPEAEKKLQAKVRRAEKEGVTVVENEGALSDEVKAEIKERLHDWSEHRHGTQVYSAGLRPFDDQEHRRYFIARDKDKKVCGLVVLAQLSKEHGFQVKYSLDFPGCPPGTIEFAIWFAIHAAGKAGVVSASFGGSAPEKIVPDGDHWGVQMRLLSKAYSGITKTFRLTEKAEFRRKFGTEADAQYVCFPKLGLRGVEALMKVLQSDKSSNDDAHRD